MQTVIIRVFVLGLAMAAGAALAFTNNTATQAHPVTCLASSGGNGFAYFAETSCPEPLGLSELATLKRYSDPPGYYTTVDSTTSACGQCFYDVAAEGFTHSDGDYLVIGNHTAGGFGHLPGYLVSYWYYTVS